MRGTILGMTGCPVGGVVQPHASESETPLVWAISGTTQITEEAAQAVYTVSYGGALAPDATITIEVGSADGSAVASADYTGVATTLTFTDGGTTARTVAVSIIEDTLVEGTQDFTVAISGASEGEIGTSQVATAIVDDDASSLQWTIAGPTSLDEGDEGTYTVSYSGVTLAPGQQATVAVSTTASGLTWPDATAGSDFTALSTVLTFTAGGATQKTVAVSTIDDTDVEGTEDFRVVLSGQSIGTMATSQVNTQIESEDTDYKLLDLLSGTAVQAYSMRKLHSEYSGGCIRLRRSSDDAESDFGFDSNGDLDTISIGNWLGVDSAFVVTWYDQSGNGDHAVQLTAGSQPEFSESAFNGLPAIVFSASSLGMVGPAPHATWTSVAVTRHDAATSTGHVITDTPANVQHRLHRNTGMVSFFAGVGFSASYGGSFAAPHLITWEKRGATDGEIWVDGVSLGTGTPGSTSVSCDSIGRLGGTHYVGTTSEIIVFGTNLSPDEHPIVTEDIMGYWGL